MRKRNKYAPEFKGKVALAAIKGEKTMAELCQEYVVHANIVQKWKTQLLQNISLIFESPTNKSTKEQDISLLHAKIGELVIERDFLKKALRM